MALKGLPADIDEIESFLRNAIEGREYSKFIFTRNLSLALELFAEWGKGKGLSREELAMLDLSYLRAAFSGSDVLSTTAEVGSMSRLRQTIEAGRYKHAVTAAIELPPLLCKPQDLHVFELPASSANFVGSKAVIAPSIEVDGGRKMPDGEGRIVVIPSADPGYDWLFGQGIAGLITMYGGANSHMAIRAAEFDPPAAIRVGPALYKTLSNANDIHLDPRNYAVRAIR